MDVLARFLRSFPWMNVRLQHVQLMVPPGKADQARAFFGGILGLAELPECKDSVDNVVSSYQLGTVGLRIVSDPDFKPRSIPIFRLNVPDLEEFEHRLKTFGIEFGPVLRPGEPTCIRFNDPFGNRIEVGTV